MHLFKKSFILFITIFLVSCALFPTSAKYQIKVDSWKGRNVNHLIHSWGYPNKIIQSPEGNKVYVYHYKQVGRYPIIYHPGSTTVVNNGKGDTYINSSQGYYSGGGRYNYSCTTWFEISDSHKIINVTFRGNDCVSY